MRLNQAGTMTLRQVPKLTVGLPRAVPKVGPEGQTRSGWKRLYPRTRCQHALAEPLPPLELQLPQRIRELAVPFIVCEASPVQVHVERLFHSLGLRAGDGHQ